MRVYVYVPRGEVPSVLRHGYLSARAYYDRFGMVDVSKYASQLASAEARYPELRQILRSKGTPEERTLSYLDWRDETSEKGASAVYFLYAPVPPEAREFVRERRGDFLRDRVLLSFLVARTRIVPISEGGTWSEAMSTPARSDELWFEGIEHGYYVPRSGFVPPHRIRVE
jgi:hypothetical protein